MLNRFIKWVTEELIINKLAHNKRFQQFAVRMDETIQTNKEKFNKNVVDNVKQTVDQVKKPEKPFSLSQFFTEFIDDVKKEAEVIRQQQQQQQAKK
jgi:hypothetical protein